MLQDSNITGKFSRNHLPTISINFATGTKKSTTQNGNFDYPNI